MPTRPPDRECRDRDSRPGIHSRRSLGSRLGPAVGYLTPTGISFTRDRDQLTHEAGARIVRSTGEVAFNYADGTERLHVLGRRHRRTPSRPGLAALTPGRRRAGSSAGPRLQRQVGALGTSGW